MGCAEKVGFQVLSLRQLAEGRGSLGDLTGN
jgi:hypothetical protein